MRASFRTLCLGSITIALILTACTTVSPTHTAPQSPPNFVLILTDDQSWVGSSAQMLPGDSRSKSDFYQTPRIEALAASGMLFSQGYAPAAKCNPTRRALQVGLTPARHIYNRDREGWQARYREYLTIPKLLRAADPRYRSAHFGKWDMRYDSLKPNEMGYDSSDGNTGNDRGGTKGSGGPAASTDPKRIGAINRRAMNFVRDQHAAGNPFFVQLSHYAVHLDVYYHEESLARASEWPAGDKHTMPEFAAMTSDLDAGIGHFMDFLDSLNLSENTYVFLMSDNGGRWDIPGQPPHALPRNFPLRGAKSNLYEGGIRVPFMVMGPGVAPGSISATAVSGLDILPTIAQLAGYKRTLPAELDGGSLVPLLHNAGKGSVQRNQDFLFFHQAVDEPPMTALIWRNFKLVQSGGNELELFDLSNDLSEQYNLAESLPEVTARLGLQMQKMLTETGAETEATQSRQQLRKWRGKTGVHLSDKRQR